MKYFIDVPLKSHTSKAEFIVRLAREPSAPPKRTRTQHRKEKEELEKIETDEVQKSIESSDSVEIDAPKKIPVKRCGYERVFQGIQKKQKQTDNNPEQLDALDDRNAIEDEISDVYEDTDDSKMGSDSEDDRNGAYDAEVVEEKEVE